MKTIIIIAALISLAACNESQNLDWKCRYANNALDSLNEIIKIQASLISVESASASELRRQLSSKWTIYQYQYSMIVDKLPNSNEKKLLQTRYAEIMKPAPSDTVALH